MGQGYLFPVAQVPTLPAAGTAGPKAASGNVTQADRKHHV